MSISLVTCYYEFESKHSNTDYRRWIKNLLNELTCNIIIFTSNDLVSFLKKEMNHNNVLFVIKPLKQLSIALKYKHIWEKQYKLDSPEKWGGRTIGCYVVWNSKFQFLKEAIDINPFKSDKFIWNDIGSMRSNSYAHLLKNYPNYHTISKDKLDIVLLKGFTNPKQRFFENEVHLSCSIFGGHKDVILNLHKKYYEMFETYLENNQFIGCDQQIMSSLLLKNTELFNLITPNNRIIDPWFWLYYYWS